MHPPPLLQDPHLMQKNWLHGFLVDTRDITVHTFFRNTGLQSASIHRLAISIISLQAAEVKVVVDARKWERKSAQ